MTLIATLVAFAFYIFFSSLASAHHDKESQKYICKLTASAGLNGRYIGGDGTPEGGQFFGEFVEQFRYADQIKLEVHGNTDVGGYIQIEDKFEGKLWAPIITANNYIANPYAPFKDAIGAEYQLTAVFVTYKYSFFIMFNRGVIRFSKMPNHPTDELPAVWHGFADCKKV